MQSNEGPVDGYRHSRQMEVIKENGKRIMNSLWGGKMELQSSTADTRHPFWAALFGEPQFHQQAHLCPFQSLFNLQVNNQIRGSTRFI